MKSSIKLPEIREIFLNKGCRKISMGKIVIACYKPKLGKEKKLSDKVNS